MGVRSPRAAGPLLVLCPILGAVLAGCAAPVDVAPASGAADPRCAEVMVRLPDWVGGVSRRETNSQATAAWGDPSGVVLRCGVPPAGPTTDRCVGVRGVDWIVTRQRGAFWRMETYGRVPGVEVLVDTRRAAGTTALDDLAGAVSALPQRTACLSPEQAPDATDRPPGG